MPLKTKVMLLRTDLRKNDYKFKFSAHALIYLNNLVFIVILN